MPMYNASKQAMAGGCYAPPVNPPRLQLLEKCHQKNKNATIINTMSASFRQGSQQLVAAMHRLSILHACKYEKNASKYKPGCYAPGSPTSIASKCQTFLLTL